MTACKKCGATSLLVVGFNSALCRRCHADAKAKHRAINGNALSTDYEVRIYASPGWQKQHLVELRIWALDDAGTAWHLTWEGAWSDYDGQTCAVEGSWEEVRTYACDRLHLEGLPHLLPVRHRDDDATSHDAAEYAIRLLQEEATPKQLRKLARYTGPTAEREGF